MVNEGVSAVIKIAKKRYIRKDLKFLLFVAQRSKLAVFLPTAEFVAPQY